jgi:hypothetical protein
MATKNKQYTSNKGAIVGDICICPSCKTEFIKSSYQQVFCKSRVNTKCKDAYWNRVTPNKRNNKTRISPASKRWLNKMETKRVIEFNPDDYEHPFSSDALGQE